MGEIIYEKHFHKETIEELEKERIDLVEAFGEDAKASTFVQRNHENDL